jgi:trimeric autotransporter adhesin
MRARPGAAAEALPVLVIAVPRHELGSTAPAEVAVTPAAVRVGRTMTANSATIASAGTAARDMAVLPPAAAEMTVDAGRTRHVTMARHVMTMAAAGTTAAAQVHADSATRVLARPEPGAADSLAAGHRAARIQAVDPTRTGARTGHAAIARLRVPMSAVPDSVPTPIGPAGREPRAVAAGRAVTGRSVAAGQPRTGRSAAAGRAATGRSGAVAGTSAVAGKAATGRSGAVAETSAVAGKAATGRSGAVIGRSGAVGKAVIGRSGAVIGRSGAVGKAVTALSGVLTGTRAAASQPQTDRSAATGRAATGRSGVLPRMSVAPGRAAAATSGVAAVGSALATGTSVADGRAATGRAATGRAATGRAATGRAATGRAATGRSVVTGTAAIAPAATKGQDPLGPATTGRRGGPTTVAGWTRPGGRRQPGVTVARRELTRPALARSTSGWTCLTASPPTS